MARDQKYFDGVDQYGINTINSHIIGVQHGSKTQCYTTHVETTAQKQTEPDDVDGVNYSWDRNVASLSYSTDSFLKGAKTGTNRLCYITPDKYTHAPVPVPAGTIFANDNVAIVSYPTKLEYENGTTLNDIDISGFVVTFKDHNFGTTADPILESVTIIPPKDQCTVTGSVNNNAFNVITITFGGKAISYIIKVGTISSATQATVYNGKTKFSKSNDDGYYCVDDNVFFGAVTYNEDSTWKTVFYYDLTKDDSQSSLVTEWGTGKKIKLQDWSQITTSSTSFAYTFKNFTGDFATVPITVTE